MNDKNGYSSFHDDPPPKPCKEHPGPLYTALLKHISNNKLDKNPNMGAAAVELVMTLAAALDYTSWAAEMYERESEAVRRQGLVL